MAKDKKSFILYADQKAIFEQLPNDKAGELIKFILAYVNDENPVTDDILINLAFTPIKQQLKRDLKKFEEIKDKRSEAGKIGANKRWQNIANDSKRINAMAKIADNVNVNVNDNVINNNTAKADVINFDNLLNFFNQTFSKKCTIVNDKTKKAYKQRLKEGYTKEQILTAMRNVSNDNFHKEHKYKYATIEFFSRADKLSMYSSMNDDVLNEVKPKFKAPWD